MEFLALSFECLVEEEGNCGYNAIQENRPVLAG
jgi:hypothetical protein